MTPQPKSFRRSGTLLGQPPDGSAARTQVSSTRDRIARAQHAVPSGREKLVPSDAELRWDRDGQDWPNGEASYFVEAAGLRWHVQQMGRGPSVLLLHGTGSSTHSYRVLAPLLASSMSVTTLDLPGHGFTSSPEVNGLTLNGMAKSIAELLRVISCRPVIIVGHSAGAAVMIVSAELDEIYALAHRIAVMYEGRITGFRPPTVPVEELGKLMAGSTDAEAAMPGTEAGAGGST